MRDHKSGRLQNSPGNTQWLSIGSKTASFSWKQILLAPGFVLGGKKSVIGSWDRLKIYTWQLSIQRAGDRWEGFLLPERLEDLLMPLTPCWQLVSCTVSTRCAASGASRCGLNCPQELIVQAPGPELWSLIGSACFFRLMSCFGRGWRPHWDGC